MTELLRMHGKGILNAFRETVFMVGGSLVLTILIALPLGILLYGLQKDYLWKNTPSYQILGFLLNVFRSVPYILLVFLLIPLNRLLLGTSFGNGAALLPLTLVGISLYARYTEQALLNLPEGLSMRALSMGASKGQMFRYFFLPSALPDLTLSAVNLTVSLLSYSAVMGIIGAGGLGEYAYRYGYQEYDYPLMYLLIFIFALLVFLVQGIGNLLQKKFR